MAEKGFGLAQIKALGKIVIYDLGSSPTGTPCEERREIYVSKSMLEEMVYNAVRLAKSDSVEHLTNALWNEMEAKP